jgi:hypothetical protein
MATPIAVPGGPAAGGDLLDQGFVARVQAALEPPGPIALASRRMPTPARTPRVGELRDRDVSCDIEWFLKASPAERRGYGGASVARWME